jgi:hypothetical protein
MAGPGRIPKEVRSEARKTQVRTKLVAGDEKVGFPLPKGVLGKTPDGKHVKWHPVTVKWWEHWRRSPQASRMLSEVDWDFLLDTALMHHAMWLNKRWEFAGEIRLRAAKFGATPEDRLRLKVEIDTPEEARAGSASESAPSALTSLDERRMRLVA